MIDLHIKIKGQDLEHLEAVKASLESAFGPVSIARVINYALRSTALGLNPLAVAPSGAQVGQPEGVGQAGGVVSAPPVTPDITQPKRRGRPPKALADDSIDLEALIPDGLSMELWLALSSSVAAAKRAARKPVTQQSFEMLSDKISRLYNRGIVVKNGAEEMIEHGWIGWQDHVTELCGEWVPPPKPVPPEIQAIFDEESAKIMARAGKWGELVVKTEPPTDV
jgi:hypothetical protein